MSLKPDDLDLSQLDPGIRQTVAFLREHGFLTVDSGDGVSKTMDAGWTSEEVINIPHVAIQCSPDTLLAETDRLLELLVLAGCRVDQVQGVENVEIQASYDPVTRTSLILLMNCTVGAALTEPAGN